MLLLPVCCFLLPFAVQGDDVVPLPGTQPLTMEGNLSALIHEAALRDMDRKIADSIEARQKLWHRDSSSPENYESSIAANREHFRRAIGLVDARDKVTLERFGDEENPALVAETSQYRVFQVRWPVLAGVTGEGLFLEPKEKSRGFVIALPDADETPEQWAGLAPGVPAEEQMARRLAENGLTVVIPTLIDRGTAGAGNPAVMMTNLPHREWIHRQAFMMGRTLIGYEVQKILALVDWSFGHMMEHPQKIGVAGNGEGGLLAFYAAAADTRIAAAWVKGYFKPRQAAFSEPLYRDVWGLLKEFGDAEIASLIAPRALVVQYAPEPKVEGPPPPLTGTKGQAAPGRLLTPPLEEVQSEFGRIHSLTTLRCGSVETEEGKAAARFGTFLEAGDLKPISEVRPEERRKALDGAARQLRQVKELENHLQRLVRISDHTRNDFMLYKLLPQAKNEAWTYAQFPALAESEASAFAKGAEAYKKIFWEEVLGKLDDPLPPLNPRSRRVYNAAKFTGYEVTLDVGHEGFAWGVLLLPKGLKPGEKRPVVVCQHGRHGLPENVIEGDTPAYHNFAARLCEEGYIVLAPHNLYQKEEYYRMLARKGHTVGVSLFSVILRHHQQWLKWLASLPQVDAQRIGFYGLSFGGESAVRIPPLLDGYCLSICSGDYNDWTRKLASTDDKHSFMFTDEWEIACFNMGNTFNYAELTYLMFPRPFMVERGHHDGVSIDSWVAYEYAKTRWLYDQFGMGNRTRIEFFNGGHTINGKGTFEFLREHLGWLGR